MENQIQQGQWKKSFFTNNILPEITWVGCVCDLPNWSLDAHSHEDFAELIYIYEGEGEFVVDGVCHKAKEGDFLLYNQNVVHKEKSTSLKNIKIYYLSINNLYVDGLEKNMLVSKTEIPLVHAGLYRAKLEEYLMDIFQEYASQNTFFSVNAQYILSTMLILLRRIITDGKAKQKNNVKDPVAFKVKRYIDENFSQHLTLSSISNVLYVSPDYISHTFKTNIGFAPISYLIQRRIEEAKKLLLTTSRTISDIAVSVGYENISSFSSSFKKLTGQTPGEYRRQND